MPRSGGLVIPEPPLPFWFACEHPERLPNTRQLFHLRACRACRIAAVASGKWLADRGLK